MYNAHRANGDVQHTNIFNLIQLLICVAFTVPTCRFLAHTKALLISVIMCTLGLNYGIKNQPKHQSNSKKRQHVSLSYSRPRDHQYLMNWKTTHLSAPASHVEVLNFFLANNHLQVAESSSSSPLSNNKQSNEKTIFPRKNTFRFVQHEIKRIF